MFEFLNRFIRNPKTMFLWGIFSKWYVVIMGAGLAAAYYFFKGISDIGLLQSIQDLIFGSVEKMVSISKDCTPHILNISEFMQCISRH